MKYPKNRIIAMLMAISMAVSAASLASVSAASNWTSDTNGSLNVQPGKTYQFKISTDNPDKINFWMGTPGVFNVAKSGEEAGAVFYKITAVGKAGDAAGVYVSYDNGPGTKVCVANVGASGTSAPSGTTGGWTSDTNGSLSVQSGKTYQFKITAAEPNQINFWMGTPGVFNVVKASTDANAVYYKITAVGTPGAAAGVYVSYKGGSGTKVCVATVAGGNTGGNTSTGNTSSGNTTGGNTGTTMQPTVPDTETSTSNPNTTTDTDTSGMTEKQKAAVEAGLTLGDYCHEYEQEVFDLVNERRVEAGIPKLAWSVGGTDLAQTRAKEISVLYSHTRPDGTHAGTENIGRGDAIPILAEDSTGVHWALWNGDPKSMVASWMGSEGHYHNMMDYEVDDAGNVIGATSMAVGCYVDENGSIWWVQVFDSSDTELRNPTYRNPLL